MRSRLPDVLSAHARERSHHLAIVAGTERVSYTRLWADANRMAEVLRRRGVRRGDRVAILMDNVPACVIALFGAWIADVLDG